MKHSDICRIAAELAYEEQVTQNSNVVDDRNSKDCPYYDQGKKIDACEVGEVERISLCI